VVRAAIVFEGMLVVGAYILGEIVERPPGERIYWNWLDALWGVAAAVPLLVLLVALMRLPLGAIDRLREFCRQFLIPMFREATWRQVLLICALAGIGEEMLFRGLIQLGLADAIGGTSGTIVGIAVASITFGLAHAATRTYAVVATQPGPGDNVVIRLDVPVIVHPRVVPAIVSYLDDLVRERLGLGFARACVLLPEGVERRQPSKHRPLGWHLLVQADLAKALTYG
jgi:hypothetical protein